MDTNKSQCTVNWKEGKMDFELNSTTYNYNYPSISDKLIKCLEKNFPDKLPRKRLTEYEQGKLDGQQDVIDKLKVEKKYNENRKLEKE